MPGRFFNYKTDGNTKLIFPKTLFGHSSTHFQHAIQSPELKVIYPVCDLVRISIFHWFKVKIYFREFFIIHPKYDKICINPSRVIIIPSLSWISKR